MSALQFKLDNTRHSVPSEGISDQVLKKQLETEQEALVMKERDQRLIKTNRAI